MKSNVLALIITLVVGVILAGSLLGPAINVAAYTYTTENNDGRPMSLVDEAAVYQYTSATTSFNPLFVSESIIVRGDLTTIAEDVENDIIKTYTCTAVVLTLDGNGAIDAVLTTSKGTTNLSLESDWVFVADNEGTFRSTYITSATPATIYYTDSASIYSFGWDGATGAFGSSNGTTAHVGNEAASVTYTSTVQDDGLTRLDASVSGGITYSLNDANILSKVIVAPASATGTAINEYGHLYMVIIPMVLISLVLVAVRAYIGAKD